MTQNKPLTASTFARLAKVVALALLGAAFWFAGPPTETGRTIVLLLPAVREDWLPPTLRVRREGPLPRATGGTIGAGPRGERGFRTGAAWWRSVLAGLPPATGRHALWFHGGDADALRAFAPSAETGRYRPPPVERRMRGGSAGLLVEATDVAARRLPPPWDGAAGRVARVAGALESGESGEWIDLETASGETFQVVRVSGGAYYLSPVYRRPRGETGTTFPSSGLGRPFLREVEPILRGPLEGHLVSLGDLLIEAVREAMARAPQGTAIVVLESIGQGFEELHGGDSLPPPSASRLRAAIASQVESLLEAAGPRGVLIVAGGTGLGRADSKSGWYRVLAPSDPGGDRLDLDPAGFHALLRHFLGLSLDGSPGEALPRSLLQRFPVRSRGGEPNGVEVDASWPVAWEAAAVESVLGGRPSGDASGIDR